MEWCDVPRREAELILPTWYGVFSNNSKVIYSFYTNLQPDLLSELLLQEINQHLLTNQN